MDFDTHKGHITRSVPDQGQDQGSLAPSLAPFPVLQVALTALISLEVMVCYAFPRQYSGVAPDKHLILVNISV